MPQFTLQLLATTPLLLAADGAALPTRLQLLKWGSNPGMKGDMICNAVTLAQLPGNQKASRLDRIAFDFEHNSVKTSPSYRGEPVKVAGYGVPEVVDGQGLFLNGIEWTDEGKHFIKGKHYADHSPAIVTNARGEVVLIHSVAACRNGALDHSTLQLNSAELSLNSMDPKKLLLAILGLAPEATDADIEAAAKAFGDKQSAIVTNSADFAGKLTLLTTEVATLRAAQASLAAQVTADEWQLVLNSAAAEGKVVPKTLTEGDGKVSLAQLKLLTASLPVTVPLEQRTPAHVPVHKLTLNSAGDAALEAEVNRQLGITDVK